MPERKSLGFWKVVVVFVTAGVVALLLGAEPLHLRAEGLSESPFRTAAMAVTGPLAEASDLLRLDRPWEWASGSSGIEEAHADSQAPGGGGPAEGGGTGAVTTTTTAVTAARSTTTMPVFTSSSTTTTAAKPVFTATDPLRILVVGDSLVLQIGYALRRQSDSVGALEVKVVTKVSSGLVRPDFYNWPDVLAHTVAEFHPHVTVVLFGGNEKQVMRSGGKALQPFTDEWNAEYALRVGAAIDILSRAGSSVVWVGMPIMRSDKFSETARTLNSFYSDACALRPGATYVDGYNLFADAEGKYAAYLADSAGKRRLMREGDGIHLTGAGGDRVAEAVVEVLEASYRLEP